MKTSGGATLVAMLFGLLSCIISLVVFFLYDYLPEWGWPYHLDKIAILLFILTLVLLLVKLSRYFVLVFIVGIAGWFAYNFKIAFLLATSSYTKTKARQGMLCFMKECI